MRPCSDLAKLGDRATARLNRLKALVDTHTDRERAISLAVIEAQNTWSNFARAFLLSLLSSARRRSGGRVALGNAAVNSPGALLAIATRACRGPLAAPPTTRREEPAWHDTSNFLKACAALSPSNLAQVQAALSLQTGVFSDLPAFRNFFAHRNEESARRAVDLARRNYLITGLSHPSAVLMRPARLRTQPLLLDWIDEMKVVIELATD